MSRTHSRRFARLRRKKNNRQVLTGRRLAHVRAQLRPLLSDEDIARLNEQMRAEGVIEQAQAAGGESW